MWYSEPCNEELHDVVRNESATLMIHEDTDSANITADIFWRIEDLAVSQIRSVNILSNTGVTNAEIEYWDYSRLTYIEGVETEQFIVVEMNKADGWFEIWRGIEVARDRISVR